MKNYLSRIGLTTILATTAIGYSLQTSAADFEARIIGGNSIQHSDVPYQVALFDGNNRQFCGGTLISDEWVLTAAHCVISSRPNQVKVRVGASNLTTNVGQTINVSQIITHERYRNYNITGGYDIAVLKLSSPADSQYTPASIPDTDLEASMASPGSRLKVSGWGLTTQGSNGRPTQDLMAVDLPVISNQRCSQLSGPFTNINNTIICGHESGLSSCNGDSGGPWAGTQNDTNYVFGIVSFGPNGCTGLSAFARVTTFTDWIESKTGIGIDEGNEPDPVVDPDPETPDPVVDPDPETPDPVVEPDPEPENICEGVRPHNFFGLYFAGTEVTYRGNLYVSVGFSWFSSPDRSRAWELVGACN